MSKGQMTNHEPSLPPLGLKQNAGDEASLGETRALDVGDNKSLGTLIREARTAKGLSAADLAQSLNLDLKVVEQLEADQFEGGPEPIYVRAYIKHWAGLVDVDPEVWLQAYQRQHGSSVAPNKIGSIAPIGVMTAHKLGHAVHATNQNSVGRKILRFILILLAIVIVLAVIVIALPGVWQKGLDLFSGKQQHTALTLNNDTSGNTVSLPMQPLAALDTPATPTKSETSKPETTEPNVAPPPPPLTSQNTSNNTNDTPQSATPTAVTSSEAQTEPSATTPATVSTPTDGATTQPTAAAPPADLVIKVDSADCWVEVRNAAGKRLVYDVIKKGQEKTVPGTGPFTITLGNPSAVTVLWKGKPVNLGAPNSTTGIVRTTVGGS